MSAAASILRRVAREFASVIPDVDSNAEHERWKPGLGPFEEENQLKMIIDTVLDRGTLPADIQREAPYPESSQRCDLLFEEIGQCLPVEAKLLRFRLDNGNIDPNMYKSVFSPFPERSSSSLFTDARKLGDSDLGSSAGLLGLYYEREDEPYDQLRADLIATKFCQDVKFWYDLEIETAAVETFEGLQHPHHQQGAIITWLIP